MTPPYSRFLRSSLTFSVKPSIYSASPSAHSSPDRPTEIHALLSPTCAECKARHFIVILALVGVLLIPVTRFAVPLRVNVALPVAQAAARSQANKLYGSQMSHTEKSRLIFGLVGVWLTGFALISAQTLIAIIGTRRLYRRSAHVDFPSNELSKLAARAGLGRPFEVRLQKTAAFATAMTWGIIRPVILLPYDAQSWTSTRFEAVLLHEMAHIRRGDCFSQLLSRVACAVYWFHPLVWLAVHRLNADAEIAADDAAVKSGVRASSYAHELLRVAAQLGHHQPPVAVMGLSYIRATKIETRICAIIDPHSDRRGLPKALATGAVICGALSVVALACLQPAFAHWTPAEPRYNPDSREYLFRKPIDPRDNPDSRAYIKGRIK